MVYASPILILRSAAFFTRRVSKDGTRAMRVHEASFETRPKRAAPQDEVAGVGMRCVPSRLN